MNTDIHARLLDASAAVRTVWLALEALEEQTGVTDMQAVLHRAIGDIDAARELAEAQQARAA